MNCDMCGKPATSKAKIEGADMTVCDSCAKYGSNVRPLPRATPQKKTSPNSSPSYREPREELIEQVRPDFAKLLRQHREKLKLTQEQFAAKLQIRASTYNHMESGASMPPIETARKLEHALGVPLVVHVKVNATAGSAEDAGPLTLGDFIKKKK